jgi:hypothetical protein
MSHTTADPLAISDAAQKAWSYPLFDAIFQRRARRFPLGAEMPGDVAPFRSMKEPVPLDELEEAMLVMAGTGISGINLSDLPFCTGGRNWCGNTMIQFVGRTYASACGSHGTELLFTNDRGTFIVPMRKRKPAKLAEYESMDDRGRVVTAFRESAVKIGEGRLPIPMVEPVMLAFNQWNVNQPGTTLFMPISDVTWEYINALMLFMDAPHRFYIYDDLNGNAEPLKKWADAGYLDRNRPVPLSFYERTMTMVIPGVEQAIMLQNMYLALQGMGLGGWIFNSSLTPVVFAQMGFRLETPKKTGPLRPPEWFVPPPGAPMGFPVGLDGLFEAYCPPYYPDMNAAVQAVWDAKWGAEGIYKAEGGPAAYKDRRVLDRAVPKTEGWCLDAAKAMCTYIWETYGRFPAMLDPMMMNIWFQAHHLDTDFYDCHYPPGAYQETIRTHMHDWHS